MSNRARTKNMIINSAFGILSYVVIVISAFFVRKFFISFFSYELLGLNTILTTIIGMFAIVELGIGVAIGFCLYKPIAEGDKDKITLYIRLFKKIYSIIALIILVIGLAFLPLLTVIVKEYTFMDMVFPYLIFLLGSVLTYLFTFNHILLSADQKQYILSLVSSAVKIATALLQFLVLFIVPNFILFVLVGVLIQFIGNICLSMLVHRRYPYLRDVITSKLSDVDKKNIKNKVLSIFYVRIGNQLTASSESILLTVFINLTIVGQYANYTLISTNVLLLVTSFFSGLVAAFGNMVATESKDKVGEMLFNVKFLYLCIYTVIFIGLFVLANDFISIWVGGEGALPIEVVFIWSLNVFLIGYSQPISNLRYATGLFEPKKQLFAILPVLSVGFSIITMQVFGWGLVGLLGCTLICNIILEVIIVPNIIYKNYFNKTSMGYFKRMLIDILLVAASVTGCYFLNSAINIQNVLLDFIVGGIICVLIPLVFLIVAYIKSRELKYVTNLAKRVMQFKRKR